MAHFDFLQALMFFLAACVTFLSYQYIPAQLEHTAHSGKSGAIVRSVEFTLFVRMCGTDHLLMAFAMCAGPLFGAIIPHWLMWVLVVSAWLVAAISAISAVVIRRASLS
jgi:hypothetical protein